MDLMRNDGDGMPSPRGADQEEVRRKEALKEVFRYCHRDIVFWAKRVAFGESSVEEFVQKIECAVRIEMDRLQRVE